jgi:hypothetical protein
VTFAIEAAIERQKADPAAGLRLRRQKTAGGKEQAQLRRLLLMTPFQFFQLRHQFCRLRLGSLNLARRIVSPDQLAANYQALAGRRKRQRQHRNE